LSTSSDTIIYLYYGNPSAVDQQNKTGVWDSNYGMVQHLASTSAIADSTLNGNTGSNTGATNVSGQIDGGANFIGSSNESVPTSASLTPSPNITFSLWANSNAYSTLQVLAAKQRNTGGANAASYGFVYRPSSGNKMTFTISNATDTESYALVTPAAGVWQYWVGTYDGTNEKLYLNGVLQNTNQPVLRWLNRRITPY